MTQTRFGLSLGERGLTREKTRTGVVWPGLGLAAEASERDADGSGERL